MNTQTTFAEKVRWRYNTLQHKLLKYRLSTNESTIADTEYGQVRGLKRRTVYDDEYYSFEGIPYAQPPVGELRFKAPQRPTPWQGVLDGTNAKDKAVQVHFIYNKVEGSEDCLYLNVYTNNPKPEKPRPVLVWIHGGGFLMGEANRDQFGPDYFIKHDVVFVTIQYRLGVLGFLSLNGQELDVPGNAGLKDQVLALKWVKNNVHNFGGNPDNITVFGESAGGASTSFMMIAEPARGLFHRAILMSGNNLGPWATTAATKRAFTIAKLAGYKGDDDEKQILEFLQKAKAKDLIRVEEKVLTPQEQRDKVMFAFAPTVEPYITTDCVLSQMPHEQIKKAWGNAIPVMIGNTSYEGLFFKTVLKAVPDTLDELDTCVAYVSPELISDEDKERTSEATKALGQKIKSAHVTGEKATADDYMDLCSHWCFLFPMHRLIQSRFAAASSAPMYVYRFDFDSEQICNPYRIIRDGRGVKGAAHADDLTYLMWHLLARRLSKDSAEYRTIERMVGIWTQFAETGNPNGAKAPGMEAITWDPVKKGDDPYKCLNIGEELKFIDLPEMEKIHKWASMFDGKKELL